MVGRSTVTRREEGRGRGGGKLLINKNSGKFRTQNIMRSGPGVRRDLLKNTRVAAAERDGRRSGDAIQAERKTRVGNTRTRIDFYISFLALSLMPFIKLNPGTLRPPVW